MTNFVITNTPLEGLKLIVRKRLSDRRGFLSRVFSAEELATVGWCKPIAQINLSYTAQLGTVRGMHYQVPPYAEMKLVSCIKGEVWDVAVDVRVGSPTFLNWYGEILSAENNRALLIPEGFAHGFQALTDEVELLYCHSAAYAAEAEGGVNPQDRHLAIAWPLPIMEISAKDMSLSTIENGFEGIKF
jgi:dTDP-4-dehydrorhamnose 3,5-epimerase